MTVGDWTRRAARPVTRVRDEPDPVTPAERGPHRDHAEIRPGVVAAERVCRADAPVVVTLPGMLDDLIGDPDVRCKCARCGAQAPVPAEGSCSRPIRLGATVSVDTGRQCGSCGKSTRVVVTVRG